MRLIHTSDLKFDEFFGSDIPEYAILSHCWEQGEVTFHAFRDGNGPKMAGWSKVTGSCAQAVLDGWEYIWIDSCCIDKSSSAELSEAINSMFRWYEGSQVCYAYLSDVRNPSDKPDLKGSGFVRSKWFKRGWTLQELLAPRYVDFFDRDWNWIGSKGGLQKIIRDITKIRDLFGYQAASVAQKMSWASFRETTRIEDQAYCLLGLFGVQMPPLYGEGTNAFFRLQLEIIARTDDDSIFAFKCGNYPYRGLLAPSPSSFNNSGSIIKAVWDPNRPPHVMSSKGLCVNFQLIPNKASGLSEAGTYNEFFAPLNCAFEKVDETPEGLKPIIALPMKSDNEGIHWCRTAHFTHLGIDPYEIKNMERSKLYVPQVRETELNSKFITDVKMLVFVPTEALHDIGLKEQEFSTRSKKAVWEHGYFPNGEKLALEYWSTYDKSDEDLSWSSVVFRDAEKRGVGLIIGVSGGTPWIDLVVLHRDESMEKIITQERLQDLPRSVRRLITGRDRVSRPFSDGALNARLKGVANLDVIVNITFDKGGKLYWPDRGT